MLDTMYKEFNNVSFDEAEFAVIEETLTEVEIKKLRNNLRKQIHKPDRKHFKLAASIALIAMAGITFATPAFAKTVGIYIPVIDTVYEKLGYYNEFKDFSQYIGVSKEDKGYKFTIDKLVADEDTVLIALRINKQGLNEKTGTPEQKIDFMMSSDLSGISRGTIMGGGVEEKVLDENTSLVLFENKTAPGKSLPRRFNIGVNIHSAFDGNVNVNFDLPVSREKIQNETILKKNLGQSIIKEGLQVKIHKLKASPINTSIKYSFDGKLEDSQFINFYTYDDKGRIYIQDSCRADDSGYYINTLNRIEKDAKKLYIIPYIQLRNGIDINAVDPFEKWDFYDKYFNIDTTREFDFKEDGKLNVYKTERNGTSIKVFYSLKGVQSELNKNNVINLWEVSIDNKDNKAWIKPSDMKLYKPDANMPDNYCVEFDNVDANKNYVYSVGCYPIYKTIEGAPLEVDLK